MKIVGFSGQMGVGKSTAIEFLKDYLKQSVKLIKFAGPLYDMQEMIYRRIDTIYTRPDTFTKDRKLLQWLGTDWGRDTISQTLWVDIWKAAALKSLNLYPETLVVCDDVRFDNEAETIKKLGGIVIHIAAHHTDTRIDTKAGIVSHASEMGIHPSLVDYYILNDGTLKEFEENIKAIFAGGDL